MAMSAVAMNAYSAANGIKSMATDLSQSTSNRSMDVSPSKGFGELVDTALVNMERKTVATDAQNVAMAKGEADVVDVVTAVAETELALEALVSVRDRVILAYEEVMRMPI